MNRQSFADPHDADNIPLMAAGLQHDEDEQQVLHEEHDSHPLQHPLQHEPTAPPMMFIPQQQQQQFYPPQQQQQQQFYPPQQQQQQLPHPQLQPHFALPIGENLAAAAARPPVVHKLSNVSIFFLVCLAVVALLFAIWRVNNLLVFVILLVPVIMIQSVVWKKVAKREVEYDLVVKNFALGAVPVAASCILIELVLMLLVFLIIFITAISSSVSSIESDVEEAESGGEGSSSTSSYTVHPQVVIFMLALCIVSSCVEEVAKYLITNRRSNNCHPSKYIYVVSGVMISLGLAFTENMLFICFSFAQSDTGDIVRITLNRAFLSTVQQAICGGIIGIGLLKSNRLQRAYSRAQILFVPILLHLVFDIVFFLLAFVFSYSSLDQDFVVPSMLLINIGGFFILRYKHKKAEEYIQNHQIQEVPMQQVIGLPVMPENIVMGQPIYEANALQRV